MIVLGYIAAVLIGISLGLIGGGGSILTVPVLVYLFGVSPVQATSYSLFIVGSTSLVGAYKNYRLGQVHLRTAFMFGLASVTTVYLTRKFLVPLIPAVLFRINGFELSKSLVIMVLFAILMLLAAISMIRSGNKQISTAVNSPANADLRLPVYGIGIGLVTGLLGAGGGFLLIPALVLLVGMQMKEAIGTSLFIIALNSLIGFTGDIGQVQIDWPFLATLTAIAIAGILAGSAIGRHIAGQKLKKGFGWFVLAMGIYILTRELLLK